MCELKQRLKDRYNKWIHDKQEISKIVNNNIEKAYEENGKAVSKATRGYYAPDDIYLDANDEEGVFYTSLIKEAERKFDNDMKKAYEYFNEQEQIFINDIIAIINEP